MSRNGNIRDREIICFSSVIVCCSTIKVCCIVWQGNEPSGVQALALFASNALMFIAPFNAVAETCEADNGMSNMPVLLGVALIGATVGGE